MNTRQIYRYLYYYNEMYKISLSCTFILLLVLYHILKRKLTLIPYALRYSCFIVIMTSSRKRGGSGSEVLGKRRGLLPNIGEYSMEETFDIKG